MVIAPLLLLALINHGPFALGSEGNSSITLKPPELVLQPRDHLKEFHAALKNMTELVLQPRDHLKEFHAALKNRDALSPKMQEYACTKKQSKVFLSPEEMITISSKNYPNNYPEKSKCKWKFTTTTDNLIWVWCYDFDLEPKNRKKKCLDYLKLNGKKFCGSDDSLGYASSTNTLLAMFKSNKKHSYYRGFECTVMSFPKMSTTTPFYTFTTPQPPKPGSTPKPPKPGSWSCGVPNRVSRIVGGVETTVNEYPWQAGLIYKNSNPSAVFCGGSVISTKYVITAAHCTQAIKDSGNFAYEVLLGGHCLSSPPSSEMIIAPSTYIQHKQYNPNTLENDISLIKLSKLIDFENSDVKPICLPPIDAGSFVDDVSTVAGWGTLQQNGYQPDCLMEVDVPVISKGTCQSWVSNLGGADITDNMICAGYSKGGKDSCQGDSGGPLFFDSGCGYEQIGVVSFGYGCAGEKSPGVYVRITEYIQWIATNVGSYPTFSCR